MKKLTKAQEQAQLEFIEALRMKDVAIDEAMVKINALIDEELNPAIEAYNEVLVDVENFRDEIVEEMENYTGERSEKWQESDVGQRYDAWRSEWQTFDATALLTVDALEAIDTAHADDLDGLNPSPAEE